MVGDWNGAPPFGGRGWPAIGGRPMNPDCWPIPGGGGPLDMIPFGMGPPAKAVGPGGCALPGGIPLGMTPLGANRGGAIPFTPGRPPSGG